MDRKAVDRAIRERYPDRNGSWVRGKRVRYVETALEDPTSRVVSFLDEDRDLEAVVADHLTRWADDLYFVKHLDWRDEIEYRWIYFNADESVTGKDGWSSPFVDVRDCVVALVLGADYADAHLPVGRIFAKQHGLNGDVVRCQWDRLNLHLTTFSDDGDRWLPVPDRSPYSLHLLAGKPESKARSTP